MGGAERTLSQLVAYGGRQGWEQLVLNPFALDPNAPDHKALYAPARYEGHPGSTWRTLPELRRWLSRQLDAFAPEVVHAHLFHASVLVAGVRRPRGARLVLSHQHGDHFQATGSRVYEAIDQLAGRRYDQVVACSESVENYLLHRYRYPRERVCYVHNGWSGNPATRHGLGESIICVARFRPQKNHRMLVEAVAGVRERIPGARLKLIGDGETRSEIEGYVRQAGLERSVQFVGDVGDVWPLLAHARVFALASTYEPFGIAVLEAMAAGLPVVATGVGGLREIVQHGQTGFLVPAREPAEMAAYLTCLLTDDELAETMGKEARQVAQRYRADRTAQGYARVYKRLMDERHE